MRCSNGRYENDDETVFCRLLGKCKWILISLLVIVLAVISALTIAQKDRHEKQQYQDLLAQGDKYLENLDYEKAKTSYEKAIKIDVRCADAYLGLADVYEMEHDVDSARDILEKAVENVDDKDLIEERLAVLVETNGPRTERHDLDNGISIVEEYDSHDLLISKVQYGSDGREQYRTEYMYDSDYNLVSDHVTGIGNYLSEQEFEFVEDHIYDNGRVVQSKSTCYGSVDEESQYNYYYTEGSTEVGIDIFVENRLDGILHVTHIMESAENEIQVGWLSGSGSDFCFSILETTPDCDQIEVKYDMDGNIISKEIL